MIRRILCLFCALLMLSAAAPAAGEDTDGLHSYDFDLVFSLNKEAFPKLLRSRIAGYADLLDRIGVRGNIAWSDKSESMDLNLTLYFIDDPSLTYPVRLFGTKGHLFFTSPMINNQEIFLDLNGVLEFAVKAKNTLGVPLPYLAFLYPYMTEHTMSFLTSAWNEKITPSAQQGSVSVDQLREISELWSAERLNNIRVERWIMALAEGSAAPYAVESEFDNLPGYYESVTGGKPLSVAVDDDSEVWCDAEGSTLFSRVDSGDSLSVSLSLPATANGYVPSMSMTEWTDDGQYSLDLAASLARDPADTEAVAEKEKQGKSDDGEDGGWYDEEDEQGSLPDLMFSLNAFISGMPQALPADASFSVSAATGGALYPNYAFVLRDELKKDGTLTLFLSKPAGEESDTVPDEIFRCSGSFVPGELKDINYKSYPRDNSYNAFAFNEARLAEFTANVVPLMVRSAVSFVAAAPASACQSFLDDLTDMGLLDMLLD